MKSYLFLFYCFLVVFIGSCSKEDKPALIPAQTINNIYYGTDAAQSMDIYLPANRDITTTRVIILIHGGGWTSGDKNDALFLPFVDSIKRRLPGFAIFNINYRLSATPMNIFPTQELDVKSAVEFIFSRKNEYLVSDKFILVGASAGAHLSMLQGYKYNSPVKIKAVVSFFGPSDLLEMYNNPVGGNPLLSTLLAQAIGKTPSQDPAIYYNSSPINFISAGSAMPTILLHGGMDPLVRPEQSLAVQHKLSIAGISNQYVLYPAGGHGDWDNATYTDALNKTTDFILANVQ